MGEVYRARDPKLGREVALKVLPEGFARDPDRVARFEREARVLASLNHPGIAAIHGFEQADGAPFLVLELVEGETLHGPLPLDDAVGLGRQMCEALEAAHEKGVAHRDLKPANIKITPEGKVKLLDFGLAKAFVGEAASSSDPARSPTMSLAMTQVGMILGTAAYMSPEQARGRVVDRRTDVWALGCVLYEMLSGRQAFGGAEVTDSLAAIVRAEPDWSVLPASTPLHIRRLLQRCLQKDPARRWQHIGDVRLELEAWGDSPEPPPVPRRAPPVLWIAAALVASLGAVTVSVLHFREKAPAATVVRFPVAPPEKSAFAGSLALSPDGRRLVFRVSSEDGPIGLGQRTMDRMASRILPGTEGATYPFWSPDSRYLAFFGQGGKLKKVDMAGGPPETVCDAPAPGAGGAWNPEGVILFGRTYSDPLYRVPAEGGAPVPVTALDASRQEAGHLWPRFLPDGRHFLYLAVSARPEQSAIYAGSLDSKERKLVVKADASFAYVPPGDGHLGYLLFLRESTLVAQAFDARRLELQGVAVPVAEQVGRIAPTSFGLFAASDGGVLAYRGIGGGNTSLRWMDRAGKDLGDAAAPGDYAGPALSPDDKHVAFERQGDIWVQDLARGAASRLTFEPSQETRPVWSPDGRLLVFASSRGGRIDLYQKAGTGAGREELVLQSEEDKSPVDWSSDGRFLLYVSRHASTREDLWVLPLEGDRKPIPFLQTPFRETQAVFAPAGRGKPRWIAYTSDESGGWQVYVQEFPPTGGKWQISTAGGVNPRWRPDGKELYYLSMTARKLMAVEVKTDGGFAAGLPRVVGDYRYVGAPFVGNHYGVASGVRRFLLESLWTSEMAEVPITAVLNWRAGLKRNSGRE